MLKDFRHLLSLSSVAETLAHFSCLPCSLSVCVCMFNCIVLIYWWLPVSLIHVSPSLFEYRYILFPWLSVMLTGCCHVQCLTLNIYFGMCILCRTVKVLPSCWETMVHCDYMGRSFFIDISIECKISSSSIQMQWSSAEVLWLTFQTQQY